MASWSIIVYESVVNGFIYYLNNDIMLIVIVQDVEVNDFLSMRSLVRWNKTLLLLKILNESIKKIL